MAFHVGHGPSGGGGLRTERGEYYGGHGRALSEKNKRRYALYSELLLHDNCQHHHGGHPMDKRFKSEPVIHHHHREAELSPAEHVVSYASPPMDARPPPNPVSTTIISPAASPSPYDMERTESGLSISSDTGNGIQPGEDEKDLWSDERAAQEVRNHIEQLRPDTQSERILRSLVNPRHDYRLDDEALMSLFSAANELFFYKRLDRRVAWDWSHQSSEQYARHIVGTTALRRSANLGGYETLIVLSTPILKDTSYNRRLLISTFLHEMIHSYLFVMCGLKAKENGGHTPGFRQIATAIDDWVGKDYLHLRDMEADLERYRGEVNAKSSSSDDHFDQHMAAGGRSYAQEPEPYRTRSPASHSNWQWAEQEDFGAPRYARAPAEMPPAHTSRTIAVYVPPSYDSHDRQHYQDDHYHPLHPTHHYH